MAKSAWQEDVDRGMAAIFQHFGQVSGQPERWDARRVAIRLWVNTVRARLGKPPSWTMQGAVGRGARPEVVREMAEAAVRLALRAAYGEPDVREVAPLSREPREGSGIWVYFIQGEHGGPIKIGSARRVESRLRDLQIGSPTRLRVLAQVKTARGLEVMLHRHFAARRLHGEWFAPCEELLRYIEGLGDRD